MINPVTISGKQQLAAGRHRLQAQPASYPSSLKRPALYFCASTMKGDAPSVFETAIKNVRTTSLGVVETCGNMMQNLQDRLSITSKPRVPEDTVLDGKVCIVTGGNAGIGLATAEALAMRGAHVVLACRSKARGLAAAQALQEQCVPLRGCGTPRVEFMEVDLGSLSSVRSFCQAFNARNLPLHLLVANAGVMSPATRLSTADGLELQFQVNFLSHWLMAHLLLAQQRERRSKQWKKQSQASPLPPPQQQQHSKQDQPTALATVSLGKGGDGSGKTAPPGASALADAAQAFSCAALAAGDLIWGPPGHAYVQSSWQPVAAVGAAGGAPSVLHGPPGNPAAQGCLLPFDGPGSSSWSSSSVSSVNRGGGGGSSWSSSSSSKSNSKGGQRDAGFGLPDNGTRVVMLSSLTHHAGSLNWGDMQSERKYDPFTSYALSKLANTITAVELQRRLDRAAAASPHDGAAWGCDSAVSAHPGIVNTSLATNYFKTQGVAQAFPALAPFVSSFVDGLGAAAMRSTANSAAVMLYAALAPTHEVGGCYIVDSRVGAPAEEALEDRRAEELWATATHLTGLDIHPSLR